MVLMVLFGLMSPQLMGKLLRMLERDLKQMKAGKLDMKAIEKLASIGCRGQYPNNCWADLKKILPEPKLPKLFRLELPLVHNVMGRFTHSVPMLLPHMLFGALWNHYPEKFTEILLGSRTCCKKFWAAVKDSPQFLAHKVGTVPGFEENCIPLKIHGDGTPVTGLGKGWGKLVDIFSVSSMLVTGNTMLRSLMIFMMFQHLICRDDDHHTMDTVFSMFIWSFKACWTGRNPVEDWNGKKMDYYEGIGEYFCGGYFFCVWSLIQDLEHGCKVYDMPNPTSNACCPLCPVGRQPGCKWYDFRPDAEWMKHMYDQMAWLAQGHPCL
jgi:hypothetical protein